MACDLRLQPLENLAGFEGGGQQRVESMEGACYKTVWSITLLRGRFRKVNSALDLRLQPLEDSARFEGGRQQRVESMEGACYKTVWSIMLSRGRFQKVNSACDLRLQPLEDSAGFEDGNVDCGQSRVRQNDVSCCTSCVGGTSHCNAPRSV
jgi:hypothetical protein